MKNIKNIKIIIEYDGTNYRGWQRQKNFPSIQEEIEKAIRKVTGEKTVLCGSGRTDAKVHAVGHVANFYTKSKIPSKKFTQVLNTELPEDIRVINSEEVPEDFHSRFSASHKRYIYKIYNENPERPLLRNYTCHIKRPLDIQSMEKASKYFIGTYDFKSFRGRKTSIKSSIRTIYSIDIEKKDDNIINVTIEGKSFLKNMVRIIAGTLIEVGLGKREIDQIPEIIAKQDRKYAGLTAPAQGLYLERVYYK